MEIIKDVCDYFLHTSNKFCYIVSSAPKRIKVHVDNNKE